MTITKTVSAILGFTMTLAMAGVSLVAQTTPAPAPKAASSASVTKSTAKHSKKGTKGTKAKSTKKAVSATPAK